MLINKEYIINQINSLIARARGAKNGVASLVNGKVPRHQLPDLLYRFTNTGLSGVGHPFEDFVATEGQTVFEFPAEKGALSDYFSVYINSVLIMEGYSRVDNTVTLSQAISEGSIIRIYL